MATDGPDPTPCDEAVYRDGAIVHQVHSVSSNRMEGWVKKIAAESGQRVDWHMAAGWNIVKAIGDIEAVDRAIDKNMDELYALQRATMHSSYALSSRERV